MLLICLRNQPGRRRNAMKKLCLLSVVLYGLIWSVAAVAGEGMVLIVKIVERQSRAEASLMFVKLTLN